MWRLALWALASAFAILPVQGHAKTFHTDAVFGGSYNGPGPYIPVGGLAVDAQGRLYGATYSGGSAGFGSVYRLTPGRLKSDPWTTEILHSFLGTDGWNPMAGVYLDASGAVFGTTLYGGPAFAQGEGGHGVIYRLDNAPGWPITVLHNFGDLPDAEGPVSALLPGNDGRLYGTSTEGGKAGHGTVFAISPMGDSVSYEIVHTFAGTADGMHPTILTIQNDGAIYGKMFYVNGAAIYRLVNKDGAWREQVIYALPDYGDALSWLLNGPNGVLYVCAYYADAGYALQLSPPPTPGPWSESDLYVFGKNNACATLTIDPSGGFVGTSSIGGRKPYAGSLFSLTQSTPGTGPYKAKTLYGFPDRYEQPEGALLRLGGLYYGGDHQSGLGGTIYDIRP